jgi:hypothetical protein
MTCKAVGLLMLCVYCRTREQLDFYLETSRQVLLIQLHLLCFTVICLVECLCRWLLAASMVRDLPALDSTAA